MIKKKLETLFLNTQMHIKLRYHLPMTWETLLLKVLMNISSPYSYYSNQVKTQSNWGYQITQPPCTEQNENFVTWVLLLSFSSWRSLYECLTATSGRPQLIATIMTAARMRLSHSVHVWRFVLKKARTLYRKKERKFDICLYFVISYDQVLYLWFSRAGGWNKQNITEKNIFFIYIPQNHLKVSTGFSQYGANTSVNDNTTYITSPHLQMSVTV